MNTDEFPMAECVRCGYRWFKRVHKPVTCPSCQSRDWDKPFKRKKMSEPKSNSQGTFDELRKKLKE